MFIILTYGCKRLKEEPATTAVRRLPDGEVPPLREPEGEPSASPGAPGGKEGVAFCLAQPRSRNTASQQHRHHPLGPSADRESLCGHGLERYSAGSLKRRVDLAACRGGCSSLARATPGLREAGTLTIRPDPCARLPEGRRDPGRGQGPGASAGLSFPGCRRC